MKMLKRESGSVTAELAIAMPTVAFVIAVTISAFGLQVERMNYVAIAASAARALGRGERQVEVQALLAEVAPEASLEIEYLANHVCAKVSKTVPVLALQDFAISERQCARKMGL
jgi:hypothetical protein